MTGVVFAHLLDEPRFDALGSIGIGAVLAFVAAPSLSRCEACR